MKKPNKKEEPKLAGTMTSVFMLLGFIILMWVSMFMTYSARL
ncbi:MAG TPA: cytochrome c oxidase subunit 2A [Bacillota bacterium]|nr:cytochrome c oxidase subunit 2A [Bacillota bacterium]